MGLYIHHLCRSLTVTTVGNAFTTLRPLLCKRFVSRDTRRQNAVRSVNQREPMGHFMLCRPFNLQSCHTERDGNKSHNLFLSTWRLMGPFMQTRRLSAVRYLDVTVANRSVGSLQSSCVEVFIQVRLFQLKMEDLDTERFIDEKPCTKSCLA
jgi:hypothetical protein